MPAVSIVITTYNRPDYVAAAIGSVLRQTERDFELVVYDDGSTDETLNVARGCVGEDPRARVIAGSHINMSAALNAGFRACSGKYFGWVDSDDGLVPTALAETKQFLDEHPDVGMVYTDYLTIDHTGRVVGPGSRTKVPYSKDRLLIDFMTFHFRLIRREVFEAVGGMDESFDAGNDYDLCLRLSEMTNIAHLARPLYLYRVHQKSVSQEKRLRQIMQSKNAIERALRRRGMDQKYNIDVELIGRFRLVPKENA